MKFLELLKQEEKELSNKLEAIRKTLNAYQNVKPKELIQDLDLGIDFTDKIVQREKQKRYPWKLMNVGDYLIFKTPYNRLDHQKANNIIRKFPNFKAIRYRNNSVDCVLIKKINHDI